LAITEKLLADALAGRINSSDIDRLVPQRLTPKEGQRLKEAISRGQKSRTGASKSLGGLTGEGKNLANTFITMTGGATDFENALGDLTKTTLENAKALSQVNSLSGLTITSLKTLGSTANVLMKAFSGTVNSIERYRIGLNRSGVDGRKFILELRRQQDALSNYNVTFKTLNDAFVNFQDNLAGVLSRGYPQQREALLRIAAVNEKFNIDINTSTRFINQLDTGLQLTAAQTDVFSRRLQKFALDTGQPVKKVFNDFTAAAGDFFVELDPDKALRKFTVFQQVARRLGTDVSNLTRLTDQFETIEGGMEFGGRLNMLLSNLGGSFDAVQATLMSQPERMRYIAEQVGQVGDRIRGMSDIGQRAILRELAGTLNVDVATIRSLINRDKSAEIQKFVTGTTSLAAMTTEDQARMAREMTTRADKAQITNEQLMGKFTIGVEKLAQSVTDIKQFAIQEAQRKLLGKLDQFAPSIDTAAQAIDKFAVEAKAGNVNTALLIEEIKKLISGQTVQANAIMAALRSRGNMTSKENDAYKQAMATMGLSGLVK
jgi:hypothetical protein